MVQYLVQQVTDVTSEAFRCYTAETHATAQTINVAAGSEISIAANGNISHPGVANIYLAKAPTSTDVTYWDGSGNVWFKVYQISAVTDGGQSITFPSQGLPAITFTLPKNLPSGQYLVRVEHIALHSASQPGGAQFYVSDLALSCSRGSNVL